MEMKKAMPIPKTAYSFFLTAISLQRIQIPRVSRSGDAVGRGRRARNMPGRPWKFRPVREKCRNTSARKYSGGVPVPLPLIFIRKNYYLSPKIFQYGFGEGFRVPYHFSEALASSLAVLWNGVETILLLIFGAADFAGSLAATEGAVHAGAKAQVTLFHSRASFFACQAGRRTGTKNGPPARGGRLFFCEVIS